MRDASHTYMTRVVCNKSGMRIKRQHGEYVTGVITSHLFNMCNEDVFNMCNESFICTYVWDARRVWYATRATSAVCNVHGVLPLDAHTTLGMQQEQQVCYATRVVRALSGNTPCT